MSRTWGDTLKTFHGCVSFTGDLGAESPYLSVVPVQSELGKSNLFGEWALFWIHLHLAFWQKASVQAKN